MKSQTRLICKQWRDRGRKQKDIVCGEERRKQRIRKSECGMWDMRNSTRNKYPKEKKND